MFVRTDLEDGGEPRVCAHVLPGHISVEMLQERPCNERQQPIASWVPSVSWHPQGEVDSGTNCCLFFLSRLGAFPETENTKWSRMGQNRLKKKKGEGATLVPCPLFGWVWQDWRGIMAGSGCGSSPQHSGN